MQSEKRRGRKPYPRDENGEIIRPPRPLDADGNPIKRPYRKRPRHERVRPKRVPGKIRAKKYRSYLDDHVPPPPEPQAEEAPQVDAPQEEPVEHVPLRLSYVARPHFVPFHLSKKRFACLVCHRRLGKTTACVNHLQHKALRNPHKNGSLYAYVAPQLKQAKSVAWDMLKQTSAPLLKVGATVRESDLSVRYHNNSVVQLYGADNPDALRGIRLDGIVLDEYADMDPGIIKVVMPALADRGGFMVYIGTPRGHNAFHAVYQEALSKPDDWFAMLMRASQSGVLEDDELAIQRDRLLPEEYAQEYECSFEAAVVGAYYGRQMQEAEEDHRITGVPYEPGVRVWVSWDLGMRDATALWFAQVVGREIHVIDYYEASGFDLRHFVKVIQQKPYIYHSHCLPHDAFHREQGTGKTRVETLQSLELPGDIIRAPDLRVDDGISAVRMLLPKCYFDKVKCARGIEALKLYRAQTNPKGADPTQHAVLKPHPVHDWTSHAADSFRYLAITFDEQPSIGRPKGDGAGRFAGEGGWMG